MNNVEVVSKPESLLEQGVETLPALFELGAKKWGEKIALKKHHSWGYQSITYTEFNRLVSYFGTGIIAQGLEKGDRVILIAENSPEWAVVYCAVVSCGGIIVPVDTSMKENEISHLLMHSGAKFLVTTPKIFQDRIEGMRLTGADVILIEEKGSEKAGDILNVGKIMAKGKEGLNDGGASFFEKKTAMKASDTAAICYTSGATGAPKGAVLTHGNIVSNIESLKLRVPVSSTDNFLCILPLYHMFSITCTLLTPLASGSTVVFGRSLKPTAILNDIREEKISIILGVPLLYEHLMEFMKGRIRSDVESKGTVARFFTKAKMLMLRIFGGRKALGRKVLSEGLENLKFCISGAAALRPDVESALISAGIPLLQGYGLTECSPVVSVNPPGRSRPGTVGTPLADVDVEISGPDDEGVGEITVSGPNVMKEYYKNPEATSGVLKDGKLFTGDIGKKDEAGYLTIMGRIKSVIVTAGGKNVYPEELELRLNRNPYILECAVVEVKDRRGNIRPGAIIVPDYDALAAVEEPEKPITDVEIRKIIAGQVEEICEELPDFKRIFDFQLRGEELARTPTNKLKRHMIAWIEE